ncbi:unnamed protein product [Ectocarpus fasciculatus]
MFHFCHRSVIWGGACTARCARPPKQPKQNRGTPSHYWVYRYEWLLPVPCSCFLLPDLAKNLSFQCEAQRRHYLGFDGNRYSNGRVASTRLCFLQPKRHILHALQELVLRRACSAV